MKVNPRETLLGWGMILLALPVMLIFIGPFGDFGENLNCLITGQDSCNILRMIGSLAIMTVYAYVCLRLGEEGGILYVTTVMFSGLSVLISWDRGAIITKIIMLAVSAGFFFIPFRLVYPKNNTRKTPRKAVVKYNIRGLTAEQKKRYRETLAKLPSDRAGFQRYCAQEPADVMERMGRDLPTLLFRDIPCKEALEFIYSKNPNNAMLLVDHIIKFDKQGQLIQK